MYPASSEGLNRETIDSIYFFTVPFEPLNNFSAHTVHIWGKDFKTSEHAFQWKKFSVVKPEIADQILLAKSPHVVKKIADANKNNQPKNWSEEKVKVMEEILLEKSRQHEDVRDALKRTEKRIIVENSPVDTFWGIGRDSNGQNMLGKIWMQIRESYHF